MLRTFSPDKSVAVAGGETVRNTSTSTPPTDTSSGSEDSEDDAQVRSDNGPDNTVHGEQPQQNDTSSDSDGSEDGEQPQQNDVNNELDNTLHDPRQQSDGAADSSASTPPQHNDKTNTRGWVNIPKDHPYLDRDDFGRVKTTDTANGNTIAERVRSRRAQTTSTTDCAPTFLAFAATAALDLASDHSTPKHYKQAMMSDDRKRWKRAMDDELKSVRSMDCYALIDQSQVPSGSHVIGYTWVYKLKKNSDGSVSRFKARICVDGSKQKYGLDYAETFSPVASAATIRMVLAVSAHKKLGLHQYDIKLAFVSAPLDRTIYMKSPAGSGEPAGSVWALRRSLYGLKQAPRLFNAKLHKALISLGWTQATHDPCLYTLRNGDTYSLLVFVVDDLLLATNNPKHAESFQLGMEQIFDFKSMGAPEYMIGMHIAQTKHSVTVGQQQYIRDMAVRYSHLIGKPANTPMAASTSLVKTGLADQDPSPASDIGEYRSLIGSLMYAVLTRPDIATSVSVCARFMSAPTIAHLAEATRVLNYLVHTSERVLTYYRCVAPKLHGYADASWGGDRDTRRSRYGYAAFYGRALVSWRSKLHHCICLSTAEAEYVSATEATKELMWLRFLLVDMGLGPSGPTVLFEDNKACIQMAASAMVSARNKHLELKMHYVRERVRANDLKLLYVGTKDQRADMLTKNLPRPDFERMCDLLMCPPAVSLNPHTSDGKN
jgi:hypothetical protein